VWVHVPGLWWGLVPGLWEGALARSSSADELAQVLVR
jgi:hypothetical protein